VAAELKRVGPKLVNLRKENKVAILFSADSSNALKYMPFSDRVTYQTVLRQMWNALYDLNIEPDFVPPGAPLSGYKLVLAPPLYSAPDAVLQQVADYVKAGGHVVMAFKSGFTDEHSTVRPAMAPGPLRQAAGFHYQEFSNLAAPVRLTPDPFGAGEENKASVWAEFLIPDTAETLASLDHPFWRFPAITRNRYGNGTLTYEATAVTDTLQRQIVRDAVARAGLAGADQKLPSAIRVRHGRSPAGGAIHYYFNFSGREETFSYPYAQGSDLLTGSAVNPGAALKLRPWDVMTVAER
jgi:beta-galactosidase